MSTDNRAEQMAMLLEVSRTMRSDRPLVHVLSDVARAIQNGTGFKIVLISVLENQHLRRVTGAGVPEAEFARMQRTQLPWEQVQAMFQSQFQLGHCYYIPAEEARSRVADLDVFSPPGTETRKPGQWHHEDLFLVPLYSTKGEIVGLLSLDMPDNGLAPSPDTASLVEIFAAQVALAIENNRLVKNLQHQVDTLQLFNKLNRSITTKLDLPTVLNTVVNAVTDLLDYDYATIFLQDEGKRHLSAYAAAGYDLNLLEALSFERGEGLIGQVGQTGLPLLVDDIATNAFFVQRPIPIGSAVVVPLNVDGHTVGVLSADRIKKGSFSPTAVATLNALADQVAVAVQNAQLFEAVRGFSLEMEQRVEERTQALAQALEDLKKEHDRSDVLYRIASELGSSLDLEKVLQKALLILRNTVQAQRGVVMLLNEDDDLRIQAAIGYKHPIPEEGLKSKFTSESGLVGWVLQKRASAVIDDVLEDSRWILDTDSNTRSVLAVPILGNAGEAWGAIFLQSWDVATFSEFDLRLVEAAAAQLSNALDNTKLYRLIRVQAERLDAMLRAQQIEVAKNKAILEGIADGVMVADANGRVILFNAAAERIFSVSRMQALGRFLDEMLGLYGERAQNWLAQVETWRQAPEAYSSDEFLAERLSVGRQVVSIHLSPVISPNDEFLGVVSVFRDITVEVEANQAKNEFVSTVSHELRTPMTAIKGYVDLILMGKTGHLSHQQDQFLSIVKSNVDRLTSLVNDLLDISRIETGRLILRPQPMDVEPSIIQVLDTLRPKVEEKSINLHASIPKGLPQVSGDAARITQILTNLAGNAYKYTRVGGEVSLHAYVQGGMMHMAVMDTGIGIPYKDQKSIFERFYRVDDPEVDEVTGSGLGLAITSSLVQMHGGTIKVESEPGQGSIFTFTLPLVEGASMEDRGEAPRLPEPSAMVCDSSQDLTQKMNHKQEISRARGRERVRIKQQVGGAFVSSG